MIYRLKKTKLNYYVLMIHINKFFKTKIVLSMFAFSKIDFNYFKFLN